jgi:hypothetical protein
MAGQSKVMAGAKRGREGIEGPSHSSPSNKRQMGKARASEASEDFNERSQTRTKLLTQIKSLLNRDVPPTLWACYQLADINCLEGLVCLAKAEPHRLNAFVRTLEMGLNSLPMLCKLLID